DLVFGKSLRNHDFTCGTKYALGNAAEPAPRFRESRAGGESRRRSLLSHEKFLGEHRGRIMARQSRALGDVRFVIGEWPSQEPANKACKSIATLVVIAHTLRMRFHGVAKPPIDLGRIEQFAQLVGGGRNGEPLRDLLDGVVGAETLGR